MTTKDGHLAHLNALWPADHKRVLPALAVEHFQDIAKVKGLCTVPLLDVIVMSYVNHWS